MLRQRIEEPYSLLMEENQKPVRLLRLEHDEARCAPGDWSRGEYGVPSVMQVGCFTECWDQQQTGGVRNAAGCEIKAGQGTCLGVGMVYRVSPAAEAVRP